MAGVQVKIINGENSFLKRWKMSLPRTESSEHLASVSKIERTILFMFTLGGFGGAASLYISEAIIDPPSNGGAAQSDSTILKEGIISSILKKFFS